LNYLKIENSWSIYRIRVPKQDRCAALSHKEKKREKKRKNVNGKNKSSHIPLELLLLHMDQCPLKLVENLAAGF